MPNSVMPSVLMAVVCLAFTLVYQSAVNFWLPKSNWNCTKWEQTYQGECLTYERKEK